VLYGYCHDPNVRVLACGGDGTMGWILSSLDKVWKRVGQEGGHERVLQREGHLPLAMMPLGTGNDLSRQFKWGATYSSSMIGPSMLRRLAEAESVMMDRWRLVVVPDCELDEESRGWVPMMLGEKMRDRRGTISNISDVFKEDAGEFDEEARNSIQIADEAPETQSFDGVFCNYFSIGIDARVAFLFHKEREEHPERFNSVVGNKLKYIRNGLKIGGLLSVRTKKLPPVLNDKLKILVKSGDPSDADADDAGMVELQMPKNCRGVALLNIQSYGGGCKMMSTGAYDDGLIEVMFVTHAMGMAVAAGPGLPLKCLRYTPAAVTSRVCIKNSLPVHCQVDGEPWLQSEGIFQVSYNGKSPVLNNKGGCCF
jgi:diacylglycerol kinase (ATP)